MFNKLRYLALFIALSPPLIVGAVHLENKALALKERGAKIESVADEVQIILQKIYVEALMLTHDRQWAFSRITSYMDDFDSTSEELSELSSDVYDGPPLLAQGERVQLRTSIESLKTNLSIQRNSKVFLQTKIVSLSQQKGIVQSESLAPILVCMGQELSRNSLSHCENEASFLHSSLSSSLQKANIPNAEAMAKRFEKHLAVYYETTERTHSASEAILRINEDLAAKLSINVRALQLDLDRQVEEVRIIEVAMLLLLFLICLSILVSSIRFAKSARTAIDENIKLEALVSQRTEKLELAQKEAEQANRLKTEFLANMSHEIRTPLNGILGMAQLLRRTELDDKQDKYANTIQSSGNALLSLINDVLDISKVEAGLMTLDEESFDLETMTQEVADAIAGLCVQKDIAFSAGVEPEATGQFIGDEKRIKQILINLAGNAVKFTDYGSVCLKVSLTRTNELRFSVQDTGPGIAEDQQDAIFGRFQQADSSATRKHGGTGLGLAISKDLIKVMGGEIGLHSVLGEGSTFWFTLPLRRCSTGDAAANKQRAASLQGENSNTNLSDKKDAPQDKSGRICQVLLAEDNIVNQKIIIECLRSVEDLRLTVVEDGEEVLKILQTQDFDLILMDINMPVMTGDVAMRKIRASNAPYADVPIIALTANALPSQREEYLNAGATAYLSKPINIDQLIMMVTKMVFSEDASSKIAFGK